MLQTTAKCSAGDISMRSPCQAPSASSDEGVSLVLGEDGRDVGQEVAASRSQQIFCKRDGEEEVTSLASRPKVRQ